MKSSLNISGIIPRDLRRAGPGKQIAQKLNKIRNKFRLKNIAASLLYSQSPQEDTSEEESEGVSQLRGAIQGMPELMKNVVESATKKKETTTKVSRKKKKSKKKDPLITKVSPSNTQPVKRGDSVADAISKMYSLMRKAYNEKIKAEELARDFAKEQKLESDRKHQEFIKALKSLQITVGSSTIQSQTEEPSSPLGMPLPDLPDRGKPKGGPGKFGRILRSPLGMAAAGIVGAAAVTAAGAKAINIGMKSSADQSIDSIMKDVTVRISKSNLTPEEKIQEYEKAIRTSIEAQTNPSRVSYIEKQLQTSEGLTPQEREIAKNYFISQKGMKVEPTEESSDKFIPKFQQEVKAAPVKASPSTAKPMSRAAAAPAMGTSTSMVSKLIQENNQMTMESQSSMNTPVVLNNNNTMGGTIGKEPAPPLPEMKVRTDDTTLNQVVRKLLRPV